MPLVNPPAAAGAPTTADYLVGTTDAGLSAEIVVGTSPGGELGGTWASPTVDATHSGSAHHTQAHVVTGADHTASGLTIGHVLTATSATAFAFQAAPGGGTWTTIIKPADTGRTNNTVSADPDLVVTLTANTNYVLRFKVFMLTNATADSRYQLTFGGTTTRVRRQILRTATGDVPALITIGTAFDAAPVVLSTTGLNPYVEENVILQVGASGGTFAFQWAQVTTNGSPCTVLEGSYLEYATT
jgi:hypothetical protein